MSLCINLHEFTHNNMERDEEHASIDHGDGEMSLDEKEPQEPQVFVNFLGTHSLSYLTMVEHTKYYFEFIENRIRGEVS